MDRYLLVYYGGNMEADPKKMEAVTKAWNKWFGELGKSIVNAGAPTEPVKSVSARGLKAIGAKPVTGYSIFQANSPESAIAMAKSSPQISANGQIDIYKLMPMM